MKPLPIAPKPGQESVWDYPRPPRIEPFEGTIEVFLGGSLILSTENALRVLETSHPPVYYLPLAAALPGVFRPASGTSFCEWKGTAHYFDVISNEYVMPRAAWGYQRPTERFAALVDHVAIYAAKMDRCVVNGDMVTPQPGGFYGGWITSNVVGPFKGGPGSMFW